MNTLGIVALCLLLGVAFGVVWSFLYFRSNNVGTLRIDKSDPSEPPYFFLEVTDIKKIRSGKTIVMKVKEENYISQE